MAGRVKQLRRRSERVTRESVVLKPLFRNSERHSRKIGGRIKHSEQNTVPPEVTERQGTSTALWPCFNTSPRDTRGKVPHFDLSTAAPRGTSDIQR